MNYHVLLNEQTSLYVTDVTCVQRDDESILFRGENGNHIAAFKLYNIIGFYRVDAPTPEYKWDFEKIDRITEQQQEEAKGRAKHDMNFEIVKDHHTSDIEAELIACRKAAKYRVEQQIRHSDIKDSQNEVIEEALRRGGLTIKGGTEPLLIRNHLKDMLEFAIKDGNDLAREEIETFLMQNMEECLHGRNNLYGVRK